MPGPLIQHQGRAWRVVEYLQDCDSWVLTAVDQTGVIQSDQFGDPRRRVPETRLVDRSNQPQLHAEIQSLMAGGASD